MTTFPDRMGSDGISGGVGDPASPSGSCADASSPSVSPLRAAIPIASEMIRRLASAICAKEGFDPDGQYAFTTDGEPNWRGYAPHAIAVLAAMREPTSEMIEAADELCPIARGTETHRMSGGKVPEDYWRAMVDAAQAPEGNAS